MTAAKDPIDAINADVAIAKSALTRIANASYKIADETANSTVRSDSLVFYGQICTIRGQLFSVHGAAGKNILFKGA